MWLLHPQFPKVVEDAWSQGRTLSSAIDDFSKKAQEWNSKVFGNLFARKRRVLARLGGVQEAIANNPSESLLRLEKQLIEEHALIMLQEEEYWALKSRLNAATFGDRNTSFFHITTVVRRQRNKIRSLVNGVREYIQDEEGIKEMIQSGFMKLYSTDMIVVYLNSPVTEFSCCVLSEEDRCYLERVLGFPTFAKGICWGIGNGSRKSVWIDNWIKGQSLRDLIEGPLTRNDMKLTIADIRDNHEWNWENLSFVLPPIIKDKIRAVPCQEFGDEKEVILWKHTKDGEFTVNSAYLQIIGGVGDGHTFGGSWIWKVDTYPKIVSFLWLCLHNSIPVREILAARGINCSKVCPICKEQDESIGHLLRDCIFARHIWADIHAPPVSSMPIHNLSDWLQANCQSKLIHHSAIPWNLIFPLAIWSIWKYRNKVKKQFISIPVKWNKPPEEWFKLNTDGASSGNPGKAGGGGLIRDCNGRWIKGAMIFSTGTDLLNPRSNRSVDSNNLLDPRSSRRPQQRFDLEVLLSSPGTAPLKARF
ncbi:hypothetical protein SO802_027483 [Lithocarpus litseifolius]|uniref:Reverse transcriptase zinc-binding domain-containing protein n=1 Tax=Lithocarpus litseifolius TaxID=425828 RepID=A0AAW2C3I1_9ROSI